MSTIPSNGRWPLTITGLEILGPIGSGGMGEVYMARQVALNRLVAVKWLRLEDAPSRDPEIAERFRREATLMASVHHPNILTIHDFGMYQGRPYLVLEFVEGGDLRRVMNETSPVPVDRVRSILRSVCAAVDALHRRGILHRDLKPENILMGDGGVPKVGDFGIAVLREAVGELTRTAVGLGTPGYVAPEQQYDLGVDERVDQYSLAALAYELLTGQKPLGVFRPPSSHNPGVPPAADAVIMKALSESPADRYAGVTEFAEAFESAFLEVPREKPIVLRAETPRTKYALSGLLGLFLIGLFGWLTGWFGPPRKGDDQVKAPIGGREPSTALRGDADEQPNDARLPVVEEIPDDRLIELGAYLLWLRQGSPKAHEGGQIAEVKNREAAEAMLQPTLEKLAYEIWVHRGSPKPTDPAEIKRSEEQDWFEAKRHLLGQLESQIRELQASSATEGEPSGEGDRATPESSEPERADEAAQVLP